MVVGGQDVMPLPLVARKGPLRSRVLAKLADPIHESPELVATLPEMIQSVKTHGPTV